MPACSYNRTVDIGNTAAHGSGYRASEGMATVKLCAESADTMLKGSVMSRTLPSSWPKCRHCKVCLAGCEAAKSANPTAPSVAGPIPGVNITAPRALEPYAGSTLAFSGEPQTLLIENAGRSGPHHLASAGSWH